MIDWKEIKFYHGTSTIYEISDYISPVIKSDKKLSAYIKRTAKIKVTTSIEDAVYYAKKTAEDRGGEPVVYEVSPDKFTLIKITKTEYSTANARVINTIKP